MSSSTSSDIDVDLLGADAVRNPHELFRRLRSAGPAIWLRRHRAWLLLDYALVRDALSADALSTDTITHLYRRLSESDRERFRAAEELFRGWMIFNDPPAHTALRAPVRNAFVPSVIGRLEQQIQAHTGDLLRSIDADEFDLIRDFAQPLPARVISELLGVPPSHFGDMARWSRQLGAIVMGKIGRPDAWERAVAGAEEMQRVFADLIAFYRRAPADNLITRMAFAKDEALTAEQLIGACSLLLFGGHETTTSLIGSGAKLLLEMGEDVRQSLGTDGASEAFVDEVIRFDGPSKIVVRRARAESVWNDIELAEGDPVFCCLMAANRDPAEFAEPDTFTPTRRPNRHLGFGWGLHYCLGAQLAKLEARVAIPRIFETFPQLRLAGGIDELRWHPTIVGRSLQSLPVSAGVPGSGGSIGR